MADQTVRAAITGRYLAITHIVVGVLLFCFGIADRLTENFWTGHVCFGIWIGIWMCIAGGLGILGTQKEPSSSRNVFAAIFMGFSITSAVLGGIIIICYSITIAYEREYYSDRYRYSYRLHSYDTEMALTSITLILGIVEFAIGIWAAICCCLMQICCSAPPPQQGQVMYTVNTGYTVAQMPGGPVAVPMQTAGGMVAVQAVTQGGQPQMIMMPASGAMRGHPQFGAMTGSQPQFVQVAPAGAAAPSYQPQQGNVSQSHGQRQYMALQDEQIPLKT